MRSVDRTGLGGSWFYGLGSTGAERRTANLAGLFGVVALLTTAGDPAWPWWKYAIGAVVAFDLAGGVVANGLDAAKRFYHGPLPLPPTRLNRFLHHEVGFAAVHLQPVVVGLVFGGPWWWGPLWYAWALAGVVAVSRSPRRLARPVGLFAVLTGLMLAPALDGPAGFAWLPAVLLVKLALAHAVPEEPVSEGPAPEGPACDEPASDEPAAAGTRRPARGTRAGQAPPPAGPG
ncbi:hypothetical protein [Streptomyces sp. MAR4 CNX-425]|uniref:hypothetical protein n=1 Tax=Streptomyces sp. MAR4 CNX-425 TaxID=3406343 RepID=UPI003B50302A